MESRESGDRPGASGWRRLFCAVFGPGSIHKWPWQTGFWQRALQLGLRACPPGRPTARPARIGSEDESSAGSAGARDVGVVVVVVVAVEVCQLAVSCCSLKRRSQTQDVGMGDQEAGVPPCGGRVGNCLWYSFKA